MIETLLTLAIGAFLDSVPTKVEGLPEPHVWAVEFGVADVQQAARFYVEALDFEIEREVPAEGWSVVQSGAARVLLRRTSTPVARRGSARVYLNMQVDDLGDAAKRAAEAGARVENGAPVPFALGHTVEIADPFGNPINLLDIEGREMTEGLRAQVFNASLRVLDMAATETLLEGLGFEVHTRDFLPETLVFRRHGALSVVLHSATELDAGMADRGALVLAVDNLETARQRPGRSVEVRDGGRAGGGPSLVLDTPREATIRLLEVPSDAR